MLLATENGLANMSEPLFDDSVFDGDDEITTAYLQKKFANFEQIDLVKLIFKFLNRVYNEKTFPVEETVQDSRNFNRGKQIVRFGMGKKY